MSSAGNTGKFLEGEKMRRTLISAVAAAAVTASLFAATPAQAKEVDIIGSGSSFAYNFLNKCAAEYQAKTGSKVSYTATGSGAGRKALVAKTVDFAATDSPYSDTEAKPAYSVAYSAVVSGAIAMVFNVDGVKELNLDPKTIGGIFDGTITNWSDAKIAALNPKANLPDALITPVYRSTNSGTTQNFQEYLFENIAGPWPAANQAWAGMKTGANVSVSSDMAYKVKTTPNSIGYVDLADVDVKVGKAAVKNSEGKFIKPSVAAVALQLAKQPMGASGVININFTKKVKGGYPIAIITYVVIPLGHGDAAKGKAVGAFAAYAVGTCGKKPFKGYVGMSGSSLNKALWYASQAK